MMNWQNMDDGTRVWIYQADRRLTDEEVDRAIKSANEFLNVWTSHGSKMEAAIEVLHGHFILIFADEAQTKASGCGIDKSVHFIQDLGKEFNIDFFNRMNVAFKHENDISLIHSSRIQEYISQGKLSDEDLIFNNLVQAKGDLKNNWIVPLSKSWVAQVL